jgi:hypothetical protein
VPLMSSALDTRKDKMLIVRAMLRSLLGLLLLDVLLPLSDSVVIWDTATPARDGYSDSELWESPMAPLLCLQS